MAGSIAAEALQLSITGNVEGALGLLRAARSNGPLDESALSLLFSLLHDRRPVDDEVIVICAEGLALAVRPVAKSAWHLRRGLLLVDAEDGAGAAKDLLAVLKLRASDDHVTQANRALLAAAQLKKKKT